MVNAWSLAASILNGTFDEDYPIVKKEVDEKTGLWKEPDPVEHSDAYYNYQRNDPDAENPFTEPKDIARAETVVNPTPKTNTYSVQELVTTGWVLLDKELTNLTKEEASKKIQNLIDNESYNPSDLRVIVDGQR